MTLKFARLGTAGNEQPAVIAQDAHGLEKYFSLTTLTQDIDGKFLASDGIERTRAALENGELGEISAEGLRIGAPVARPGAVVAIGLNYTAHAAESGATPPEVPVVFLKPSNTIAGPFDAAPIPPSSEKYDWEVELAIVIGREASYLSSVEEAEMCIAGYAVANDLSEREYQIPGAAGQWTKGKTLPGSTPLGPWLVPAADIDAANLRLRTLVNGEDRQDSTTSDMIFDPATIVHHLSQYMILEPGDVIITGTPEGVALSGRFPFIQPGDVVELEIEGLGRQRQEFYRAQAGSARPVSFAGTNA
ncbi:fumarylacetoacetate hydrolase family protein [Paenarthrobacter nicotinovorans]|uniref:fumarylacetoacetate hydrolase family protein n=1 Tax=Paenarthrobacter nicotinovorans TaxID=29320 RepID=UPI0016668F64|nr:fumarylacetoacetate hydrolase family protein [Paenarthrobacter nicotinovorans]MBP2394927.1 2-keto-4-pentenoate hydratase/2-oxohepta-3-ene-1,7-dioic acid hydratase in catechol pathway [Paenarthrobacter nicotinovorans]UKE98910.1 fumarylacetoacetate hydrolase family protein [Paenarthrobacter nicotinovorans]UKF03699.1 fumarylacetoacetate hydrolase family protein [Paenarthrobacter nicotinovorans]GGV44867.1 2-hydroxyhepta-2,4-diene-1,7-dioate isomerase [Paenarthrobacter nicotinovorans]